MKSILLAVLLLFSHHGAGQVDVVEFESSKQMALYQTLIKELRCLVCQNQNLADSNAELAQDLRGKVSAMIVVGKDYGEITDYMVTRYGEFILYKPRFNAVNLFLWVAPFTLLFIIIFAAIRRVGRSRKSPAGPYTKAQLQHARSLMDEQEK